MIVAMMPFSTRSKLFHGALVLLVAAFFAITSPYGAVTYLSFPLRFVYWTVTVAAGWLTIGAALRLTGPNLPRTIGALVDSLAATLVVFGIIYFVQLLVVDVPVDRPFLGQLVVSIWVISAALAGLQLLLLQRAPATLDVPDEDTSAQLLAQLPFEYRESNIRALQADDHYVLVHTSVGKNLHYIRLRDAIALMGGIPGYRVHRSWWVTADAIRTVERKDGRWLLTLEDDLHVPVSKSGTSVLRDAKLI